MFRSIKAISLLLMVCMAAATGCAASAPSHSAMAPAYGAPNDLYGGGGRGQSYRANEIQTVAAKDVSGSLRRAKPNNGPGDAAGDTSQRTTERKLIRNAWIDLQVKDKRDFDPTIESLTKLVEGMNGYVQSESSHGMTAMVPTERLDEALAEIAKFGKITHRNISVVDATANYVDMQIRIENLKKMRVRLTELVNQSTSVAEVLEVERELSRVTSELERLEGQMRVLGRQTTYATINVSLKERVRPGPLGWVFYGLFRGVKWLFVWD